MGNEQLMHLLGAVLRFIPGPFIRGSGRAEGQWLHDNATLLGPCEFVKRGDVLTVKRLANGSKNDALGESFDLSANFAFIEGVPGMTGFAALCDGVYDNELRITTNEEV